MLRNLSLVPEVVTDDLFATEEADRKLLPAKANRPVDVGVRGKDVVLTVDDCELTSSFLVESMLPNPEGAEKTDVLRLHDVCDLSGVVVAIRLSAPGACMILFHNQYEFDFNRVKKTLHNPLKVFFIQCDKKIGWKHHCSHPGWLKRSALSLRGLRAAIQALGQAAVTAVAVIKHGDGALKKDSRKDFLEHIIFMLRIKV